MYITHYTNIFLSPVVGKSAAGHAMEEVDG